MKKNDTVHYTCADLATDSKPLPDGGNHPPHSPIGWERGQVHALERTVQRILRQADAARVHATASAAASKVERDELRQRVTAQALLIDKLTALVDIQTKHVQGLQEEWARVGLVSEARLASAEEARAADFSRLAKRMTDLQTSVQDMQGAVGGVIRHLNVHDGHLLCVQKQVDATMQCTALHDATLEHHLHRLVLNEEATGNLKKNLQ